MLVKLMLRFTTNVTSSPTTSRRNESARAATASSAGPSAVANARYSASVQPPGSRSAALKAASTSASMRSGRGPVPECAEEIAAGFGATAFGVDRGVQVHPAGGGDVVGLLPRHAHRFHIASQTGGRV